MAKHLIPLTASAAFSFAIFAACTIGDPDDPSPGDGDGDMGGDSGDGDGDGTGGIPGTGGTGGNVPVTSCDECDELCDEEDVQISCSCLPGAKLGPDMRSCLPLSVLYLGDSGFNAGAIRDRLVVEGFDVVDAAPFFDWNGVTPSLSGIDVVVFLQGQDYTDELSVAADEALTEWMLAGGTVIRSEWITYQLVQAESSSDIDQYLPVEALSVDSYGYEAEWFVTDPIHPLTAGLDDSWMNVDGGCAEVEPFVDTVVVAESDLCGPMLSYHPFGQNGGKVIHINDDFGEDRGEAPDENTLIILVNAINYGAQ
jgi:hypothetical protein